MATRRERTRIQPGRGGSLLWGLIGVLILIGLVLLVFSLLDLSGGESDVPSEQFGIGVGEAVENPNEYQDESVTVSGEVNQVLDPFAYTIGGEEFADGHELLIIGPPPPVTDDGTAEPETSVQPEDIVQVSGNLRQTDVAEIEQDMEIEISADIPQELQDQPILVAQGSVVTARQQPAQGDVVEVEELIENQDEYIGDAATIEGEVTDSFEQAAVEVDGELLVIDTTETLTEQALEEAESVQAAGEIIAYDQEAIQDEVDLDIDGSDLDRFEGQPVMLADALQLLPDGDQ